MKRAFFKMKEVQVGEELIVKENYGKLILTEFYIFNDGADILKIKINNSDEVIIIKTDENFTFEYPIYIDIESIDPLNTITLAFDTLNNLDICKFLSFQ